VCDFPWLELLLQCFDALMLSSQCTSLFGHVARLDVDMPTLQLQVSASLRCRPPGRPRNKWLDQLRDDSAHSIGDLWRRVVGHGHTVVQRLYMTMMMI